MKYYAAAWEQGGHARWRIGCAENGRAEEGLGSRLRGGSVPSG